MQPLLLKQTYNVPDPFEVEGYVLKVNPQGSQSFDVADMKSRAELIAPPFCRPQSDRIRLKLHLQQSSK